MTGISAAGVLALLAAGAYFTRAVLAFARHIAVVLAAVALIVAGCASGAGPLRAPPRALTPRQAVLLAARKAQQVTSFTAVSTSRAPARPGLDASQKMRVQLRPTVLGVLSERTAGNWNREIVTRHAIYLSAKGMARALGKPWSKLTYAKLGTSFDLDALVTGMANASPAAQLMMMSASGNLRRGGQETAGGVSTTRYTGTCTVSAARAALPPGLRPLLIPTLKALTGRIRFSALIDARHQLRQISYTEEALGVRTRTTEVITSVDQPVKVTLPPARSVITVPLHSLFSHR